MQNSKPFHHGAPEPLFTRAKELRQRETPAETILWKAIRDRKIKGAKFRRQHPIGRFVVDFYCHEAKLAIELDGSIHDLPDVKYRDEERESLIKDLGITVLRFENEEVFFKIEKVLKEIEIALEGREKA
ncbi:MAG: DUF559 domain-containing protein [Bacteroidetes bacterium]|nr:DUF559 domain-containing protein [Bacteroidota bacterium]